MKITILAVLTIFLSHWRLRVIKILAGFPLIHYLSNIFTLYTCGWWLKVLFTCSRLVHKIFSFPIAFLDYPFHLFLQKRYEVKSQAGEARLNQKIILQYTFIKYYTILGLYFQWLFLIFFPFTIWFFDKDSTMRWWQHDFIRKYKDH